MVSRRHCEIISEDKWIYLTDLDSENGTFVNNGRVNSRRRLNFGDLIQVGPLVIQLVQAHSPFDQVFNFSGDDEETGTDRPVLPPALPAGLGSHALEIIKLLAEGSTEKEVAEKLRLNRNTLHEQVKQIYRRLDITSRAQLAAWYYRGGST